MQKSVGNFTLGTGRVGEFYDAQNQGSIGRILNSATEANNVVGRVVLHVDGSEEQVGIAATGNFAGILGIPTNYIRPTFEAQAFITNSQQCEVITSGHAFVNLPAAANQGDFVYYSDTDGSLVTAAPAATAPVGHTRLPGGKVYRFEVTVAGIAVVEFDSIGSTETPA